MMCQRPYGVWGWVLTSVKRPNATCVRDINSDGQAAFLHMMTSKAWKRPPRSSELTDCQYKTKEVLTTSGP